MRVSAAAAPSGVVTFLFTDIEGSTRRWEADPDGMQVALAAHDEVLRSAIDRHGDWLFKHTGDGICAAFASARSAVDAAMVGGFLRRPPETPDETEHGCADEWHGGQRGDQRALGTNEWFAA